DNHLNVYLSPAPKDDRNGGFNVGKSSAPKGASVLRKTCAVSLTAGWLLQADPPSNATLTGYLTAAGNNISAFGPFGGGYSWNSSGSSLELGVGTPQFGYTHSYSTLAVPGVPVDYPGEK